jgi:hypothetical protein
MRQWGVPDQICATGNPNHGLARKTGWHDARKPWESPMKLAILTSLATAMFLTASISVQAQMGSSSTSSGSMSNASSNSSITCQVMMDRASGLGQPTDLTKKAEAKRQMDMAKAAMAQGDEASCQSHMKVALHNMM